MRDNKKGGVLVTERAYKIMGNAGAANLAIGIIMIIAGVTSGVILLISGANLFRAKKGLTF